MSDISTIEDYSPADVTPEVVVPREFTTEDVYALVAAVHESQLQMHDTVNGIANLINGVIARAPEIAEQVQGQLESIPLLGGMLTGGDSSFVSGIFGKLLGR